MAPRRYVHRRWRDNVYGDGNSYRPDDYNKCLCASPLHLPLPLPLPLVWEQLEQLVPQATRLQ